MPIHTLQEPCRIAEPREAKDFSSVLSRVASERQPIIFQRNGEDLAAVIPVEQFVLLRDALARHEAERLAAQINWNSTVAQHPPPSAWFERDEPKPF